MRASHLAILSILVAAIPSLSASPGPRVRAGGDAHPAASPRPSASAQTTRLASLSSLADAQEAGGESGSLVQVANLIYAKVHSSVCFSDHFLLEAERKGNITTSRRFHSVKLDSEEIFQFPLLIMTGDAEFELGEAERRNLRRYLERGGMLLASAGCSSQKWDRAFRSEIAALFPGRELEPLEMGHPIFHTVHDIDRLEAKQGAAKPLEGLSLDGRLTVVYSADGLNDTANTRGCCCCGGNEITNCESINMNILAYALAF